MAGQLERVEGWGESMQSLSSLFPQQPHPDSGPELFIHPCSVQTPWLGPAKRQSPWPSTPHPSPALGGLATHPREEVTSGISCSHGDYSSQLRCCWWTFSLESRALKWAGGPAREGACENTDSWASVQSR